MATPTLGDPYATTPELTIRFTPGVPFTFALSFAYAEADAGLGVSAGDPVDLTDWAFQMDAKRAVQGDDVAFSLTEGDGIDATDAATGTLVFSVTAADAAKGIGEIGSARNSKKPLYYDLRGLPAAGRVWYALRGTMVPEGTITRQGYGAFVEDLGASRIDVSADPEPVSLSVTVVAGGGSGLDARLTAVKAALTEGVTSGLTLDPSGDLVPDDITLIDPVDYATGQVVTKQGDGSFGPSTPSGSGDMTAAVYDPTTVAGDAFDRANHTGEQAQSTVTDLVSNLAAKAPLASPALTGTPTAPTAAPGTDTTQVATAAFVQAALAAAHRRGDPGRARHAPRVGRRPRRRRRLRGDGHDGARHEARQSLEPRRPHRRGGGTDEPRRGAYRERGADGGRSDRRGRQDLLLLAHRPGPDDGLPGGDEEVRGRQRGRRRRRPSPSQDASTRRVTSATLQDDDDLTVAVAGRHTPPALGLLTASAHRQATSTSQLRLVRRLGVRSSGATGARLHGEARRRLRRHRSGTPRQRWRAQTPGDPLYPLPGRPRHRRGRRAACTLRWALVRAPPHATPRPA